MKERSNACLHAATANAFEALADQAAVVGVELAHVGNGAQGHQVQQGVDPRLLSGFKCAALAQLSPQGQQHVKHHAHAHQRLARKGAVRLVGVHDHVGFGQADFALVGHDRQVVVGDDDLQAQRMGFDHRLVAGHAVVHGHQNLGLFGLDQVHDGRGQAIAMQGPIGHDVIHLIGPGAQHAQASQGHGTGGGAVAVVVGHDADALALLNGIGQHHRGLRGAFQVSGGQQFGGGVVQLFGRAHAAGGKQARQQGVHTGLLQAPDRAGRHITGNDVHKSFSKALRSG